MLIHVLGQISYKKGCLVKVLRHLEDWNNPELVKMAAQEILNVHKRYERFSEKSCPDARKLIIQHFGQGVFEKLKFIRIDESLSKR